MTKNAGIATVDRPTWIDMMSWLAIRSAARGRALYFGGDRFRVWT